MLSEQDKKVLLALGSVVGMLVIGLFLLVIAQRFAGRPPKRDEVKVSRTEPTVPALDIPSAQDRRGFFSDAEICRAGIAALMLRSPKGISARDLGYEVRLSYVRESDDTSWTYKCKIEGSTIRWGADDGRWRTHPLDSKVFFREVGAPPDLAIEVIQEHSDGSSTTRSYDSSQLR